MESYKRRFVTCWEDGIIGRLPDHLIGLILERLPIEDAVRTSILSKKWRTIWTTMMNVLNFDDEFSDKMSKKEPLHRNGFISTMNKIMISHKGPIFKFHLRIPDVDLGSFEEVDQWMLILSRNSVRELTVKNSSLSYQIPSSLFLCLQLRQLGLHNCVFKPPLEFQGFPNLELLALKKVDFGPGDLRTTVISLPRLKTLILNKCFNVKNFRIKAGKLQDLWVGGCPDAMLLNLLDSEHLNKVHIILFKPIRYNLHPTVERFNLETMLRKLSKIVFFTIDGYFLKFLAAEKFQRWLSRPVTSLRRMEFLSFSFGDLEQVKGALCMLRNSPNLKVLCLTHARMGRGADLESTSNYLESPDCLQTLCELRKVEITSFEGSKPELLFIKLLLIRTCLLKDMIIQPRPTADAEKMLNDAKDVMMFPRASKKARVVYLHPQP